MINTKVKPKKLSSKTKWAITAFFLLARTFAFGQVPASLTLETCHRLAQSNFPLAKQFALIEKTREYSIENVRKGILPKLQINGQGSYQSDVTQIPVALPNIDIPVPGKGQYRLYGEISQSITDLSTVGYEKELIRAHTEAERQKTAIELYRLKERVNQLYFGILLMDAQLAQTEILKKDILSGINKNKVAVDNGAALKSSGDVLKAEWLKADQRTIELKAARKGYADMLSQFIGQAIDERTHLEKPPTMSLSTEINRPELRLFDAQKKTLDVREQLVDDRTLPRFSVFAQGGYGRPGLNMLRNDFAVYYIGGVRLTWNISHFYTQKHEKQLLSINQHALDVQQETFLFNTNLTLKQQNSEIAKLEELLKTDREIVRLRETIKLSAQNQLENGTITTNDYAAYVNAEDLAKQNLVLHEIQLLMAQYQWAYLIDN